MPDTVAADSRWAERLGAELDQMVNDQFGTPEFRLILETPLTVERARFEALQMYYFVLNRRDFWAYVQAKAPFPIKQVIWAHEQDELISDARVGIDHGQLARSDLTLLGLSDAEIEALRPDPLCQACLDAWLYQAITQPWLTLLGSVHFTERRNNNQIVKGGGWSARWRDRLATQLGVEKKKMVNANVHVEADEGHSDQVWDALTTVVTDEESYRQAIHGARECARLDRAFRAAMGHGMRAIPA